MRSLGARMPVLLGLAGGLLVLAACAPLGAAEILIPGPGARHALVEGQVRTVDLRRSRVEVRDQWNRSQTLRIDRSTRVVYRQRDYPLHALERGDIVRIRVARDRNGGLWADRIDVRESVRERGDGHVRAERLTGTVARVDGRRGHFVVQRDRHGSLVVYLPSYVSRDDARRFQRLRRGDRVRVDVVPLGRGTAELVRFR
jgi:hypothetical protein